MVNECRRRKETKNEIMDLRQSHAAEGNKDNDGTVESRDAECNGWCARVISCDAIRALVVVLRGQKILVIAPATTKVFLETTSSSTKMNGSDKTTRQGPRPQRRCYRIVKRGETM